MFSRFADGAPVGDVIPFFDRGIYHLFCLTPPLDSLDRPERLRTSWRHLASKNLLYWEELPVALAPGDDQAPDRDGIWTGSVLRVGNTCHIFYTGHTTEGSVPQSICHATSQDLLEWEKDQANPVSTPHLDRFEGGDWRDPFVFWNESDRRYWMLLSARSAHKPAASRGTVALSTSEDLVTWSAAEDFYGTFLTHCPECPELFSLGDRWVLAYSRFTDRRGTVYRTAATPKGPWSHFLTDGPDGANWYAAKSLTDDSGRRIAFGWIPDRNPSTDAGVGRWLWGGDLAIPRELRVDDGQLVARPPAEVEQAAAVTMEYRPSFGTGDWHRISDARDLSLRVDSYGRFGYCVLQPETTTEDVLLSLVIQSVSAAIVGVAVRTDNHLNSGLAVLLVPREKRAYAVDLAAVRSEVTQEYEKAVTEYAPVAECALPTVTWDEVSLRVVVRGNLVEAFVAGIACLTYRLAGTEPLGLMALLIEDGNAQFCEIKGLCFSDVA